MDCSEVCKSRRKELESEIKTIRRDHRTAEERLHGCETELIALRQYKESHGDTEVLMSALTAMQEKNSHLEHSLSAETRIKLDLFTALGEAKRHLDIAQSTTNKNFGNIVSAEESSRFLSDKKVCDN